MYEKLIEIIKEWEMERGLTVSTLQYIKSGGRVRPATAYRILIGLGKTKEEAGKIINFIDNKKK